MDINSLILFLQAIPTVGPYIGKALSIGLSAVVVCTSLVAVMHAGVGALQALALIPGLSSLQNLANKMKSDDDAIQGFWQGKVLPVISQLSVLPPPKV